MQDHDSHFLHVRPSSSGWNVLCKQEVEEQKQVLCAWGPGWTLLPGPGQKFYAPGPSLLKKHLFLRVLLGASWVSCSNSISYKTLHTPKILQSKHRELNSQKLQACHCRNVFPIPHCQSIFAHLNITFRKQQDIFLPKMSLLYGQWHLALLSTFSSFLGSRSYRNKTTLFWHSKRINAALQGSWLNQDVNE